ncbi:queuosine_QueD, queuosine biosynthesis protein QueD [uncultured Caudovirales phage]|uniref:Queuosine_QueD, queuosine biosynthesis protein QueD n=1 Tax=uncultured Caudovirales phage TaxID=2100421 RepID=A0A6J5N266_9CAUD|nr:queuosine_QueD, queuosine biosynthesis protein QueD [uncultured Caudovirales phage]
MYISTKIFDNFSVALRQWKAKHSHCQLLHGYALKFKVWFSSDDLDSMNWIVDFGSFGHNGLKDWLNDNFDHTTLIEQDDPYLDLFEQLSMEGLLKLKIMPKMGCESLAKMVFDKFNDTLAKQDSGRSRVIKVEVFENDKNSAIYEIKS